jgi:hypothetical protein
MINQISLVFHTVHAVYSAGLYRSGIGLLYQIFMSFIELFFNQIQSKLHAGVNLKPTG